MIYNTVLTFKFQCNISGKAYHLITGGNNSTNTFVATSF